MSDDPSTWLSFTTEQSVRLVLEYMPVKPRAVIASSLSVRAWGELNDVVGNPLAKVDITYGVVFAKYNPHTEYPLCMMDVKDIERVRRLLWWLQRTQPRAIHLVNVEKLSAEELRQVLDVLFSDEPVLPDGVPLYTNLLEFSSRTDFHEYHCTNILEALGKCSLLTSLDLTKCESVDSLQGVEKFTHLEVLNLSCTTVKDLSWLRSCKQLTRIRTLNLCACRDLKTTAGIEALKSLEHIVLSHTGVTSLEGLGQCTSLRTVNLAGYYSDLEDFSELKHLQHLEKVCLSNLQVKEIYFLRDAVWLKSLDLTHTQVEDLVPLLNCKALRKLTLEYCRNVKRIEALEGLVNLEELDLSHTKVSNIEPLRDCIRLEKLNVGFCQNVRSFVVLENLKKLKELDLSEASVEDLTFLEGLVEMKMLCLFNCKALRSVAPLAGMTKLEILQLCSSSVADITPLSGCQRMRRLRLQCCNGVRDLRVLKNMPLLEIVRIGDNVEEGVITDGLSEKTLRCIEVFVKQSCMVRPFRRT